MTTPPTAPSPLRHFATPPLRHSAASPHPHSRDQRLVGLCPLPIRTIMYARVVTQDFVKYGSDNCRYNIRESWNVINEWFKNEEGQKKLATTFGLCNETVTNVAALKSYIENAFATVAMVNYPYPTDFLAPLPGWPIEKMCNFLNEDLKADEEKLLMGINSAVNIYYNSSGQAGQCVDIGEPGSESDGLGVHGWDFQTCTEMTIPFCNTGIILFFPPQFCC